ncbi:MAG: NusG domain II-containing protein [Elusimicrobia bacterium]|nr:NusG domain II-containing protein [Elusimicrobiota bacterium]
MTRHDVFIVSVISVLSLFLALAGYFPSAAANYIVVRKMNQELLRVRLPDKRTVMISDRGRINLIKIDDFMVKMEDSSCPGRYCVNRGWIKNQGDMIICAPLALVIEIKGGKPGYGTDAVAR